MITTSHKRPFKYPIIKEYAALGLDPTKIELLCLFDTSGNLYDASGNQTNGVLNFTGFTGEGRYGIGGKFDGVDDYTDHGDILGFDVSTTPFSVSAWFNKVDTAASRTIISKREIAGNAVGWELRILPDETARFVLNDTAANTVTRDTNDAISSGEFNHLVATYNGSKANSGLNLYLNGVPNQAAAGVGVLVVNLTNAINLQIGIRNIVSNPFNGIIDNVMIYSDVLNASQVNNLFNAGL